MKNNVIFGMGIFHTANGLKVPGQAKINVRQMSRGDSFGCVIFKILWDNGAKTQPRQNTGSYMYFEISNELRQKLGAFGHKATGCFQLLRFNVAQIAITFVSYARRISLGHGSPKFIF